MSLKDSVRLDRCWEIYKGTYYPSLTIDVVRDVTGDWNLTWASISIRHGGCYESMLFS